VNTGRVKSALARREAGKDETKRSLYLHDNSTKFSNTWSFNSIL